MLVGILVCSLSGISLIILIISDGFNQYSSYLERERAIERGGGKEGGREVGREGGREVGKEGGREGRR